VSVGTLGAALGKALAGAGQQSGAEVFDLTAGKLLFAQDASRRRLPASIEKLYTSVAALERLGPQAQLKTTLLGTGRLAAGGVWEGNLYLRGGGDPTFGGVEYDQAWTNGLGATVAELVNRLLRRTPIRRVTGKLFADESLFSTERGGPAFDDRAEPVDVGGELGALTYDHGRTGVVANPLARGGRARTRKVGPGVYAAFEVAGALRAEGVSVDASAATAVTPGRARRLARVDSPPLADMIELMDTRSDVFYAELLAEQLGARFGGRGDVGTGARVIAATLSRFGIGPDIVDGSGVSRVDRTSPHEVVATLAGVAAGPLAEPLRRSLAIPGVRGTLADRMRGTAAVGRCWAKTGTLAGASNVAGYCQGPGHHLLAFAFLMDGLPLLTARSIQDAMMVDLVQQDPG
jgi:D-alanyl-D-alanine carboxypeptidase/D-alanyl-D-alanine-endopeptidase (penicillin-binding protein 4)